MSRYATEEIVLYRYWAIAMTKNNDEENIKEARKRAGDIKKNTD